MKKVNWLTTQETAQLLRLSAGTIADMVKRGDFGPVARFGNRYRFTPEQVEEYIKDHTGEEYHRRDPGHSRIVRRNRRPKDAPKLGEVKVHIN